jgi:hypothetical protein
MSEAYGTSAATPVFAGIAAKLNELRLAKGGAPMGFLNPFIYQHPEAFNDVTTGRNGLVVRWIRRRRWDTPHSRAGTPAACYQLLPCCCWHVISYCRAAAVGMLSVAVVLLLACYQLLPPVLLLACYQQLLWCCCWHVISNCRAVVACLLLLIHGSRVLTCIACCWYTPHDSDGF